MTSSNFSYLISVVVRGGEKTNFISRPMTLPKRLYQSASSRSCANQQMPESSRDIALVDTDESVNKYVGYSEIKDYNLINRSLLLIAG